ncbi:MFS-type transporter SLC18B1-like isoform X2 [Oculina patagonica]
MAIMGFFGGIYIVQLIPDLVEITRDNGWPVNSATRSVISTIYSSMVNLGATIGPTLAGIIDQYLGFQWATVLLGIICFSQAVVLVAFILWERTKAGRGKNPYSSIPDTSDEEDFKELVLDSAHRQETG